MKLFDSEAWRIYWIGKAPRVKKAAEEYLSKIGTDKEITQSMAADNNNCTEQIMRTHLTKLKKMGLIENKKFKNNREITHPKNAVCRDCIHYKDRKIRGKKIRYCGFSTLSDVGLLYSGGMTPTQAKYIRHCRRFEKNEAIR